MPEGASPSRYRAFISYCHADVRWAIWLQRALEGYRVPSRLQAGGGNTRKLGKFCRDRTELASSNDLGNTLKQALADSSALIVICSPAAAASRWVNEEIRQFRALGRGEAIFSLIVDGEPNAQAPGRECFPPALRYADDGTPWKEHLAADVRPGADSRHDAMLRLAAGFLGVGFDALRQRDLQQRYRRMLGLSVGAMAISAAMAVLSVVAYRARIEADQRRVQAEDLIEFMLGDLREKLQPVGRLEVLDAMVQKTMDYFDAPARADRTDAALAARARALEAIARIRSAQGNLQAGIEAASAAVAQQRGLVARHPHDTAAVYALGDMLATAAELQMNAARPAQARANYEEFRQLMSAELARDSRSQAAQEKLGDVEDHLAMLDLGAGDYASALRHSEAGIAYLQKLHAEAPQQRTAASSLALEMAWKGYELYFLGRLKEARAANQQTVAYARGQAAANPADMEWQFSLSRFLEHAGAMAEADGDFDAALASWSEADTIAGRLVGHDPQNLDWRGWQGAIKARFSVLQLKRGDLLQADAMMRASRDILADVYRRDPARLNARIAWSDALLREADFALLQGAPAGNAGTALSLWQGVEPDDVAKRSIVHAHLIEAERLGTQDLGTAGHLQAARILLDSFGGDARDREVQELWARYDYLSGDVGAGEARYRQLVATGDRQPFLARIRGKRCRAETCNTVAALQSQGVALK